MKEYTTEFLRNVALVSHGGAGKTMLAESFLHATGATTRLGKVEDGTAASDYDDEEHRRKISIYSSVIPIEHRDHKINIIDAPGYTDFVGEAISALSVADGAIILVDAVAGIEVGTELAWRYDEFNLPRFFVINKMDRDNADFQRHAMPSKNLSRRMRSAWCRCISPSARSRISKAWWMSSA
ncbi:MAG: GTP-binding protein [Anaerolineales bacterium]